MRTTAGGALVRDRKILLGLRSAEEDYYPNTWDIFGGHVETGESPEGALLREIEEELGVVPTVYERVAIIEEPDPKKYGPGRHYIYAIHRWTGTPTNVSDEHQDVGWFDLHRLATMDLASDEYSRIFSRYA